jgi:hypothetical protein
VTDPGQIVAIQRDVERPERDVDALVAADRVLEPGGDDITARAYADERESGKIAVPFDDLVRDARDGSPDVVGREDDRQLRAPFPASQDRSLKVDACTVSICAPCSRSSASPCSS